MATPNSYLLIFGDTLYESADLSGTSWVSAPFPPGGPNGVIALATGAGVNGWVLDCSAYNDPRETHMRGISLLWTTQPNQACNWGTAANPPFNPIIPSCPPAPPPSVVIQQYASGAGHVCRIGRTEVDLDSANVAGFLSMW